MEELDYKNIKCDETHKYCSLSKRVETKLKMFLTVVAITVVYVITFSGCDAVKEEIITLTPTQQITTSASIIKDTTDDKNIEKEIIKPAEEESVTTKQQIIEEQTTTKKIEQEIVNREDLTTTNKNEDTTKQQENIDNEYNKLREQLDKELETKNFPEEVNKLFVDTLNRIYENYSTWQHGYDDMPTKEEYIRNNLISIISAISQVNFYDRNSKEAQEKLDNGSPAAWTEIDENNNPCIGIIAKKSDVVDPEERKNDIEKFFHEIIHCKQMSIMLDANYFKGISALEQIAIEGGATFHMKFTNPYTSDVIGMWSISNENGDKIIDYTKNNGLGYLVEMNVYEKLVYLVGYEIMDKIEQGNEPITILQKSIEDKYGEEQANNFLQKLVGWYELYKTTWKGEEIYYLSIELEKMFLEFINQDIKNLNTKQELEKYIQKYEYYIGRNLPQVRDQEYNNHAYEVFEVNKLEELIKEKRKEITIKTNEQRNELEI